MSKSGSGGCVDGCAGVPVAGAIGGGVVSEYRLAYGLRRRVAGTVEGPGVGV